MHAPFDVLYGHIWENKKLGDREGGSEAGHRRTRLQGKEKRSFSFFAKDSELKNVMLEMQ